MIYPSLSVRENCLVFAPGNKRFTLYRLDLNIYCGYAPYTRNIIKVSDENRIIINVCTSDQRALVYDV